MPHVHAQPGEYDFTASAFIVHKGDDGVWRILLLNHVRIGRWIQPGGHVETTEDPWQAVGREIAEETGLNRGTDLELILSQVPIGLEGSNELPLPFNMNVHDYPGKDHKHIDIGYAFISKTEKISPATGESQEIGWFTAAELQKMSEVETPRNVVQAGLYVLAHVS